LLDARLWWTGRDNLIAGDFSFALIVVAIVSSFAVISYVKLDRNAGSSISGRAKE
jgi:hypothetical protein